MFRDYVSTFDEFKKNTESIPHGRQIMQRLGVDAKDFESVYKAEMGLLDPKTQALSVERLKSELEWYRVKRPFFNRANEGNRALSQRMFCEVLRR